MQGVGIAAAFEDFAVKEVFHFVGAATAIDQRPVFGPKPAPECEPAKGCLRLALSTGSLCLALTHVGGVPRCLCSIANPIEALYERTCQICLVKTMACQHSRFYRFLGFATFATKYQKWGATI